GRSFAMFSVSSRHLLAMRSAERHPRTRLEWFDRSGRMIGDFGEDSYYPHPEISPDGSRIAFNRLDPASGNCDIWIRDLVRNVTTRLTFDAAVDSLPVWSPDG